MLQVDDLKFRYEDDNDARPEVHVSVPFEKLAGARQACGDKRDAFDNEHGISLRIGAVTPPLVPANLGDCVLVFNRHAHSASGEDHRFVQAHCRGKETLRAQARQRLRGLIFDERSWWAPCANRARCQEAPG